MAKDLSAMSGETCCVAVGLHPFEVSSSRNNLVNPLKGERQLGTTGPGNPFRGTETCGLHVRELCVALEVKKVGNLDVHGP